MEVVNFIVKTGKPISQCRSFSGLASRLLIRRTTLLENVRHILRPTLPVSPIRRTFSTILAKIACAGICTGPNGIGSCCSSSSAIFRRHSKIIVSPVLLLRSILFISASSRSSWERRARSTLHTAAKRSLLFKAHRRDRCRAGWQPGG